MVSTVQALVCSADSYFLRDGVYNFDPSLLKVCKVVMLTLVGFMKEGMLKFL
jgi:hypothetical protein